MSSQILATKLYAPSPRPGSVTRPRLINRLRAGFGRLTLVSAPAGFGKTTLVTQWIADDARPVGWISLDESDSDPIRFFLYFVSALQTIEPEFGVGIRNLLKSPQPPPIQSLLTPLLNEMAALSDELLLVLDDYHALDNPEIDAALTFLIDNQPPQIHLVITTREDPRLPLARLRARGQLTELRAADLRFTAEEAAAFLNETTGLSLSPENIEALEQRTEGWIAGLQLAAISMQGQRDIDQFIRSFTGSHHFVLDYLVEEVLDHQPEYIHAFLLKTSILDRMCGPLCDAILQDDQHSGQNTLDTIRQANLFVIPLDNQRRWYRYHHLFSDLLRRRLLASDVNLGDLHIRASIWYETNNFQVEAFQHAAAANDIDRTERLIEAGGTPLYLRGEAKLVSDWLASLTVATLDARPMLWVIYAWVLWITYQSPAAEEKLNHAESALNHAAGEADRREMIGNIAAMRAMLAANEYRTDTIIEQSNIALQYLRPDNIYVRMAVARALGIAYHFQGDRAEAIRAYMEAIAMCEKHENVFMNVLASTGLGMVQELQTQLPKAQKTFERVIELVGQPTQPLACAAYLGLARIHYEWNDLHTADTRGTLGVELARQIEGIDTPLSGTLFLAKVKLAQGDVAVATRMLHELAQEAVERGFTMQQPRIAELQARILLNRGHIEEAQSVTEAYELPLNQARLHMARGNPADALAVLTDYQRQASAKDWREEYLRALVLQALAYQQNKEPDKAMSVLGEALSLANVGGFVRIFVDEGTPMKPLLAEAIVRGVMPDYSRRLLAAFDLPFTPVSKQGSQALIEPLSERELEILALVAEGLSNREICERLFLALSTVKGHNRNIFDKLHVRRRTEAVARARELGLI